MRVKTMKAMMVIMAMIVTMVMVGCGSSGSSKTYATTAPAEKAGTSITVTSGGDADLNYAYATDGSIIVGSDNGDINIVQGDGYINNTLAEPDGEGGFASTRGANSGEPTCGGGDQGSCPSGQFYCPIEGKCIPSA